MYLLYICYSKLLGSHNDVSVLSKSVMGLKKSFDRGVGGWGELYSFFCKSPSTVCGKYFTMVTIQCKPRLLPTHPV